MPTMAVARGAAFTLEEEAPPAVRSGLEVAEEDMLDEEPVMEVVMVV